MAALHLVERGVLVANRPLLERVVYFWTLAGVRHFCLDSVRLPNLQLFLTWGRKSLSDLCDVRQVRCVEFLRALE